MHEMNISLPVELHDFVEHREASVGRGTASDYVCGLIRRDQDRVHLHALMLEGWNSSICGVAGKAYFRTLRAKASGIAP